MNEKAFEALYKKFQHYMKKEMGYLCCSNIHEILEWEKFKELQKK